MVNNKANRMPDDLANQLIDDLEKEMNINPPVTPLQDKDHPHKNSQDRNPGDHPHKDMNRYA